MPGEEVKIMSTPYPPPNNPLVCLVRMVYKRDNREFLNTFHVSKATAWTGPQMAALLTAVATWYQDYYKAVIPNDVTLTQLQARKLDPLDPLAEDAFITSGGAGTRGGPTEAGNVSITMSERTGLAGRRFRGRMYVPGVIESDVTTDDRVGSALVAGLSAAISQLIAAMVANSWALGVFHRPGLVPSTWDNTITEVLFYVIENILDSQRRRLPQRGR
jgi:hypothetical protein